MKNDGRKVERILLALLLVLLGAPAAAGNSTDFLQRHWQHPIAPQGTPPEHFNELERRLDPAACGTCHVKQFADWQTSLHARAMGPGLMGQLVDMGNDPDSVRLCQQCHAPLAEQQPGTPISDPALRRHGLVCAACHLRQRTVYGPPPRQPDNGKPGQRRPHDGYVVEPAYQQSEFCGTCHQFGADDFALNGKPLENTLAEWRASRWARDGVQCQDCHMPDRRHLWRGIHDPDMVRSGVTIEVDIPDRGLPSGDISVPIRVRNTGTGHYFPTYLTPKVFINAQLIGGDGQPIEASLRQAVIGRDAPLDLSEEWYDTRIPPDEAFEVNYQHPASAGQRLRVWIEVDPDHFYRGFFEASLAGGYPQAGRSQIEQALDNSRRSSFVIFDQHYPIGPPQ